MTAEELRKAVDAMLRRAPNAEAIASSKAAQEFKVVAEFSRAAKSKGQLETAIHRLKRYYL